MNSNCTITVTGSVNAGICISFPNGRKLWFDFYPDGATPLFSHMKADEWETTKKDPRFSPPDLVFFSHTHPDNFSAVRTAEIRSIWPDVPVYLPEGSVWRTSPEDKPFDYLPITGDEMDVTLDGITVQMIRATHSGHQYADLHHYSFLVKYQGKQIFLSGDALLTGENLITLLECTRTDLAILTFPWASTSMGRERVEYSIQPAHLLLYHIPNEEDNRNGFREAAMSGSELLNTPDVRLLLKPFQQELYTL